MTDEPTRNNMRSPLVSVIIPVYNDDVHIGETIESILQQEFQDFEIIVVDDNSSDNTRDVVNAFVSNKIKYIFMDCRHGGPSKPRNVGIRTSKGKFIAFCDSDDIYLPGRMTDAIEFMESYQEIGMTFTKAKRLDDLTKKDIGGSLEGYNHFKSMPKQVVDDCRYIIQPQHAYDALFFGNFILPSGVTIPKRVLDDVGGFDESLTNADDWDLWLRISKGYAIGFIDKFEFCYRIRAGNISSKGGWLAINRNRVLEKHVGIEHTKEVRRQIRNDIAENNFNIGYMCQVSDEMVRARRYFCLSLRMHPSLKALKGLIITLLGRRIYHQFKEVIAKLRKCSSDRNL